MSELFRTIVTIVLFLGILGILVLVHELGHFVTARLMGVRVLEFGIGFPPRYRKHWKRVASHGIDRDRWQRPQDQLTNKWRLSCISLARTFTSSLKK